MNVYHPDILRILVKQRQQELIDQAARQRGERGRHRRRV
jgi:hypothetical protein